MSNLAFAYRGLGRYADAQKVGDEAVKLEVATAPTRRLLYQLGIMMNDGSAAAQIEWSKSVPREYDLDLGAGTGGVLRRKAARRRDALRTCGRSRDGAKPQRHGVRILGAPRDDGSFLRGPAARLGARPRRLWRARPARRRAPGRSRGSGPLSRSASPGSERRRASSSSRARQRYPESTLTRTVFIPTCEAAIAVGRGAPAEAITALEAATPTEFGTVAGLVPTFLRGRGLPRETRRRGRAP